MVISLDEQRLVLPLLPVVIFAAAGGQVLRQGEVGVNSGHSKGGTMAGRNERRGNDMDLGLAYHESRGEGLKPELEGFGHGRLRKLTMASQDYSHREAKEDREKIKWSFSKRRKINKKNLLIYA